MLLEFIYASLFVLSRTNVIRSNLYIMYKLIYILLLQNNPSIKKWEDRVFSREIQIRCLCDKHYERLVNLRNVSIFYLFPILCPWTSNNLFSLRCSIPTSRIDVVIKDVFKTLARRSHLILSSIFFSISPLFYL